MNKIEWLLKRHGFQRIKINQSGGTCSSKILIYIDRKYFSFSFHHYTDSCPHNTCCDKFSSHYILFHKCTKIDSIRFILIPCAHYEDHHEDIRWFPSFYLQHRA